MYQCSIKTTVLFGTQTKTEGNTLTVGIWKKTKQNNRNTEQNSYITHANIHIHVLCDNNCHIPHLVQYMWRNIDWLNLVVCLAKPPGYMTMMKIPL